MRKTDGDQTGKARNWDEEARRRVEGRSLHQEQLVLKYVKQIQETGAIHPDYSRPDREKK